MLNRTASSFGRNAIPIPPTLLKLDPEQRARLVRSSQKISKVLGTTPVIDVVSPSENTSVQLMSPEATPHTKGVRSFVAQHSPASFIHSVVSKKSSRNEVPKSPVAQYRISITPAEKKQVDAAADAGRPARSRLQRDHVPPPLPLTQPQRTEALPLSPFRYSTLRAATTPVMSPLDPVSPLSPITEAKVEQSKQEKLAKLEKLAQCASTSLPQELIYPSFGQVEEKAERITSYLDLYRIRSQDDSGLFMTTSSAIRLEEEVMEPENNLDTLRPSGRMSRLAMHNRRSMSAHDYYTFADALELQSARFAFLRNSRISRELHSPFPFSPRASARTSAHSYVVVSPSVYSATSADFVHDPAEDIDVPVIVPETVPDLRSARSFSRAKENILGADAALMAAFRTGFGARPLSFALPPFPAPTGPLPSPPLSPALARVKSPRAPYWVKRAVRPRDSRLLAERRASRMTPRTLRFERRMGWGGQWDRGNMAGMIDSLREL
ncbi:hypothetical protein WOLCODRAFT_167309 [Wolfiporia cocos MD-104 SS10]|uniref:Uncharacterized protein n=1 Tax=Wolfiporia cocos (strain MD-104) TaxID=742152 RepID=A0A2H3J4I5_WOLCO|nr:hypothetical protein WOLCODRAFT_167309 [Wolfiporia cocos MD-104 SS10]